MGQTRKREKRVNSGYVFTEKTRTRIAQLTEIQEVTQTALIARLLKEEHERQFPNGFPVEQADSMRSE